MKSVKFHPDAESEMIAAAAYYEGQQPGLGGRFLTSVQDAVNRIMLNPGLYPIVELDVCRCLTKTFPFGVLFRKERAGLSLWRLCICVTIRTIGRIDRVCPKTADFRCCRAESAPAAWQGQPKVPHNCAVRLIFAPKFGVADAPLPGAL